MRGRNATSSTERLLQATFACVARYGIAKTTVEDVAREAGMSRATVYRQFPGGKDQLIADTIRWEATRFFAELAVAIEDSPDFETTLEDAIVFARGALDQHAVFQKVLETEPDLLAAATQRRRQPHPRRWWRRSSPPTSSPRPIGWPPG